MFLPIGDEPNVRNHTPVANYALIAVNVLVFVLVSLPLMGQPVDTSHPAIVEYLRYLHARMPGLSLQELLAQTSAYDLFAFLHGYKPGAPSLADLFFSLFLHGGWLHLVGNMLFLWIYGDNVEARLGHAAYLLVYVVTGVAATLFFAVFAQGSLAPLIGASGAISGVLGCYFLWFPDNRVRVLVVLFIFIDVWRVPARWVLGAYLLLDNLLPFLLGGGEGGVAHGAHLGGFLAGLVTGQVLRTRVAPRPRRVEPEPRAWVLDQQGQPIAPLEQEQVGDDFHAALAEGRWRDAAARYSLLPFIERRRLADEDVLGLADALSGAGHWEAALGVVQQFIGTRPDSALIAPAHLKAGVALLQLGTRLVAARQHFLSVLDLDPSPAYAVAARRGLAVVEEQLRERGRPN